MKKVRIYVVLIMVICMGAILSGCVINKEHVHLKTEREMKNYAEENFPQCTFVRFEEEEESHTAYFTDDKCGFEFHVSSRVKSASFDGAHAGYEEQTFNNWEGAYRSYLNDKLYADHADLMDEDGFAFERQERENESVYTSINFGDVFAYVKTDHSFEETAEYLQRLGKAIKETDAYGLCNKCDIWAFQGDDHSYDNVFVVYRIKDDVFYGNDEREGYKLLDKASEQLGVQCIFVKYEMLKYSEIPNSSRAEALEGLAPDREIGVCFFTTPDGKQKFIADFTKNNEYYIDDVEENLWED